MAARIGFEDVSSFAYDTLARRMPAILSRIIDDVHNKLHDMHESGDDKSAQEGIQVIPILNKLRHEMQTDKVMPSLTLSNPDETKLWNEYISEIAQEQGIVPVEAMTWFKSTWLLAECYLYGRVNEIIENCNPLKNHDPFRLSKETSFTASLDSISALAALVAEGNWSPGHLQLHDFRVLLQFCLWGNKSDLSLHADMKGASAAQEDGEVLQAGSTSQLKSMEKNVISNHTNEIWTRLMEKKSSKGSLSRIDFVLDNSGFELFTDLCLAHWLIATKLTSQVKFHAKTRPWFVSDASEKDIHWLVTELSKSDNSACNTLGKTFQAYLENNTWIVQEDIFWTLPQEFDFLQRIAPKLHADLEEADIVLFKGDLNYRKLLADRQWHPETPLTTVIQLKLNTIFVSLRTLKSEVIAGLEAGVAEKLKAEDENWLTKGRFGVIQAVFPSE
eukprot:m.54213 g.54213  ORF g.54213 m.54213 type:complete len:445 (+) comp10912_c0_seq1:100-1434(+)